MKLGYRFWREKLEDRVNNGGERLNGWLKEEMKIPTVERTVDRPSDRGQFFLTSTDSRFEPLVSRLDRTSSDQICPKSFSRVLARRDDLGLCICS